MTGAARLAAAGARRGGAGMVTIAASGRGDVYRSGEPGVIVTESPLETLLQDPRRTAWVCGPGLGIDAARAAMKVLMGSVTAKVIGHAPCKVLVVPKAARIEYRRILVATDGSEHSNAAVSEAIGIAKRCGSSILALSAVRSESELEEARANVNKALEMAQKEGLPAEALTPLGRPYEVIVETAGGRGVDLIVMGSYGKTGLKKFFMGSSTEKVIGLVDCAVLAVRQVV